MRFFLLFCPLVAFAQTAQFVFPNNAEQPPSGLEPQVQKDWLDAPCKWKVISNERFSGYAKSADSAKRCFALGRLTIITVDSSPGIDPAAKAQYRKDTLIIYDNHRGQKQICHLIAVKDPYDKITVDDYINDMKRHRGDVSDQFIERLNENINLNCLVM